MMQARDWQESGSHMSEESANKTVEITSIDEFRDVVAAQARVGVFEDIIKTVLAAGQQFEDVQEFSDALVAAMFNAAEADMKFLQERMK